MPRGEVRTLVKDFTQGVGRLSTVFWKDHRAQAWLRVQRAGLCAQRLAGGSLPGKQEEVSRHSRYQQVGKRGTPGESGSSWSELSLAPPAGLQEVAQGASVKDLHGLHVLEGSPPRPWA